MQNALKRVDTIQYISVIEREAARLGISDTEFIRWPWWRRKTTRHTLISFCLHNFFRLRRAWYFYLYFGFWRSHAKNQNNIVVHKETACQMAGCFFVAEPTGIEPAI